MEAIMEYLDVKKKIETTVIHYEKFFKKEFELFLRGQSYLRYVKRTKWAELKSTHGITRQYGAYPETLDALLQKILGKDDFEWFKSQNGQEWFMKRFPEFRVTERI